MGCRYDRAATWAARIVHEADQWNSNLFLTLTYRDKSQCNQQQLAEGLYLPEDGSLNKKHFQKFIKRLRHYLGNTRIRYYGCGEYGDENYRPHYHACIFNLSFSDEELYSHNQGYPLSTSKTLEDLWGYGFATFGKLTYESAAYTSRYCLKKMTGPRSHDHYLRCDEYGVAYWIEPEFSLMSRGYRCPEHRGLPTRPTDCNECTGGIGSDWINTYWEDVYPDDEIPLPKGVIKGTPRFYDEALKHIDPDLYDRVKKARSDYAKKNPLEFTPQRLEAKFKCKKALKQHLKRKI
jgi:hypothetical protein